MRMRAKVIAVVAAICALLAPASVAHAAPAYSLQIAVEQGQLYPHVDDYIDSTRIDGEVSAGGAIERIRGSVVVTVGARVVRVFPLSSTGQFHLVWDGKTASGTIVPGTTTVTLRVDDQAVSDTLTVSAKRLVKITTTTTQTPWISMNCTDDKLEHISDNDAWFRYFGKICAMPRDSRQNILRLTLRGKVSQGPVVFEGYPDKGFWAADRSVYPPVVSVTSTFRQSGSGTNQFYLCVDSPCSPPATSTLRQFTTGGTYTTTGVPWGGGHPSWRVVVAHGHDLSFSRFRITITYWLLS